MLKFFLENCPAQTQFTLGPGEQRFDPEHLVAS